MDVLEAGETEFSSVNAEDSIKVLKGVKRILENMVCQNSGGQSPAYYVLVFSFTFTVEIHRVFFDVLN